MLTISELYEGVSVVPSCWERISNSHGFDHLAFTRQFVSPAPTPGTLGISKAWVPTRPEGAFNRGNEASIHLPVSQAQDTRHFPPGSPVSHGWPLFTTRRIVPLGRGEDKQEKPSRLSVRPLSSHFRQCVRLLS
jgi:hypothetical protein